MTERWFRDGDRERGATMRRDFDEVIEGGRHGLLPDVSRALWQRVRSEGLDEQAAIDRFHEVAVRIQRRSGSSYAAPGKQPRSEAELAGGGPSSFYAPMPGKRTLVEEELYRRTSFGSGAPGKQTLVEGLARGDDRTEAALFDDVEPVWESLDDLEARLGSGTPLDGDAATRAAESIGQDVSGARIHTGPVAAALAARYGAAAFAVGQNVVMGNDAPPAGTLAGDAVLAHELAHTAQQKGAASDPAARRRPIGREDQAAEHDAGLLRFGALPGATGRVMQTGLQLQRWQNPARITELRGKAAEQKLAELGGRLVTDPDFSDGHKAVVGSHVQYSLLGARRRTSTVGIHQWTHDGPDGIHMQSITGVGRPDQLPGGPNGVFANLHNTGSTTIPLSKVGTYRTRAWVRAGVDNGGVFEGYELYIDHALEVTHLLRATHEAHLKVGASDESFQRFRDTMEMQTALLRPGGPEQQNRDRQFQIATTAPNPAPVAATTLSFTAHDTRADARKPLTYHWYVSPQTTDKPPDKLGDKPLSTAGERLAYDFGVRASIAVPAEHAGFWVIWYRATDASGAPAGEASYLQTILGAGHIGALEKHDKYMRTLGELGGKLEGEKVPINGAHVASGTGAATRLRLFVGRKKGEPSTFLLIDVTPGLDPKSNPFEYASASADGAIREFLSRNKYPKGMFRIHAAQNALGIDSHVRDHETSGQGKLEEISSKLSWGGMAALGVGILAAPFTRGQSLQVALVISGALTAAGATVSIYDKLQNAEVSTTGVTLDVITIASSMVNAGGAIRALRVGPGIALANRATKFLLWSNFVADGVSGLLIGVDGVRQLAEISDDASRSTEQKRAAMVRVVTNLVITGTLLAVSNLPARSSAESSAGVPASSGRRKDLGRSNHDGHEGQYVAETPVKIGHETHHVRLKRLDTGAYIITLCSRCTRIKDLANGAVTYLNELIEHGARAPHGQAAPKNAPHLRARVLALREAADELERASPKLRPEELDAQTDRLAAQLQTLAHDPALAPVLARGADQVKPLGVDVAPAVHGTLAGAKFGDDALADHWVAVEAKAKHGDKLSQELADAALKLTKPDKGSKLAEWQAAHDDLSPEHAARVEREAQRRIVDEYFRRLEAGVGRAVDALVEKKTQPSNPGFAAAKRVQNAVPAARAKALAAIKEPVRYTNAGEWEASLVNLPPGERVGAVDVMARERARHFKWRDAPPVLRKRNQNRLLFADTDKNVYSVDTQHGRFEMHDKNGKHVREINFDGAQTSERDKSGQHDLSLE